MLFQQALQIVDNIIAQISMSRAGHVEAQQAVATLEQKYNEALAVIEKLQAASEERAKKTADK